jgi:hypothetical protein
MKIFEHTKRYSHQHGLNNRMKRKGGTIKRPTPPPLELACTLGVGGGGGGVCSSCGERRVGEIERHQPSRYPSSRNPMLPHCESRILIEMLWGR